MGHKTEKDDWYIDTHMRGSVRVTCITNFEGLLYPQSLTQNAAMQATTHIVIITYNFRVLAEKDLFRPIRIGNNTDKFSARCIRRVCNEEPETLPVR